MATHLITSRKEYKVLIGGNVKKINLPLQKRKDLPTLTPKAFT